MKIVAGTFGLSGRASIQGDNSLRVAGAKERIYRGNEVVSLAARSETEKKFGCFSFLFGAVLLSVILAIFLGVLGVVIGVVLAAFGSFYANNRNLVDISFADGESVTLECDGREVKQLVRFKG